MEFFPRYLRHVKGEWAGTPFTLAEWQANDIIRPLFGWKRPDGTRRYRKAFIFIPRKNGKSTLGAGIALKGLCADGEPGAEIYGAAYKQDQAGIIYDLAAAMVDKSPELRKRCKIIKSTKRIWVPSTGNFYWAIPNEAAGAFGFNAHYVVFDELHTQKTPELYEALTTAQASRRQPLIVFFSTAGYDLTTVCGQEYEYAKRVLKNIISDDTYFGYIRELPARADFRKPKYWIMANPGLGVSVKTEFLEDQVRLAENDKTKRNSILRYNFNRWTGAEDAWIPVERWDRCKTLGLTAANMKDRPCYVAVDLASSIDLAAAARLFPPLSAGDKWRVLVNFWIPEKNIKGREERDRVPYGQWVEQGWIKTTSGDVTDYDVIQDDIMRWRTLHSVKDICVDPWNATQFLNSLIKLGAPAVEFGQGYKSMSPPTKRLERLVQNREILHDGNPVLRWMFNHAVVAKDEAGNLKPDRKKSREKIDGIVALVMALGRAMVPPEEKPRMVLVG